MYKTNERETVLPSIEAYIFSNDELTEFIESNKPIPKVFDTNLINGCNVDCKYCSTMGGKSDVRFPVEKNIPYLTDNNFKELIRQLGGLGVRTFFICSNGEPLLNPERFLYIIQEAESNGVKIITYTNGTTLDSKFLRELHQRKVNLVMKLESFNPELNDGIILNPKSGRKRRSGVYRYETFRGKMIPTNIIDAFNIYGSDSNMLALETMITKDNIDEVLEIREWSYESLNSSQFLKHLYNLGYVSLRGFDVMPMKESEDRLREEIIELDTKYGMIYPDFTLDIFSYDVRRFMNNTTNNIGFPFRMFAHERGGVYHGSSCVPVKFGFGTNNIIKIVDEDGKVNIKRFFEEINKIIQETKM